MEGNYHIRFRVSGFTVPGGSIGESNGEENGVHRTQTTFSRGLQHGVSQNWRRLVSTSYRYDVPAW